MASSPITVHERSARDIAGGRRLLLSIEDGETVPGLLLVPTAKQRIPAALLLHGYSSRKDVMLDTAGRALLARGVAAGVITPAQRDALLALPALPEPAAEPTGDDARRALDGVTIAYALGAALVVFALGWFLADRWATLGPLGVLAVAAVYAALFGGVAAGLFSLEAGQAAMVHPGQLYRPDPPRARRYARLYERYCRLDALLMPVFREIGDQA
jgi:hypothetical protein